MCNQLLKMNPDEHEIWNPCDNLFAQLKNINYAIVVLNTKFRFCPDFLLNLWNQARVKITVDGGTAKWWSWLKSHNFDDQTVSPPDLITGDMDSLPKEVLEHFVSTHNSKVVKTPDQNETDFTKSLIELNQFCTSHNIQLEVVYVIADTCGRLDQIFANINTLYKAPLILENVKLFQVASNSLTWLLFEGKHTIMIPSSLRENHEWCSLIPFHSPTTVSSSGLMWNLDNSRLEFGGMVSTSNTYDEVSSKVVIETDRTIVWSMGISSLLGEPIP